MKLITLGVFALAPLALANEQDGLPEVEEGGGRLLDEADGLPEVEEGGGRLLDGLLDDEGSLRGGRELSCPHPQPDATWQNTFTYVGHGICSELAGTTTTNTLRHKVSTYWWHKIDSGSFADCQASCLADPDCYGYWAWDYGSAVNCGLVSGCTQPTRTGVTFYGPWYSGVGINGNHDTFPSSQNIHCWKRDINEDPVQRVCDPTWGCRKGGMELYDSPVSASTEDGVRFTKLGWTDDLRTAVSAGTLGVDQVHTVEFTMEKLVHKADAYVGITKACFKDLGELNSPGSVTWWGAAWLIAYDSNGNKTNQRLDHAIFGWTQGTKVQMVVDLINDTVTFFLVTNGGLLQAGQPIAIDHEEYHFAASIDHTRAEVAVACL